MPRIIVRRPTPHTGPRPGTRRTAGLAPATRPRTSIHKNDGCEHTYCTPVGKGIFDDDSVVVYVGSLTPHQPGCLTRPELPGTQQPAGAPRSTSAGPAARMTSPEGSRFKSPNPPGPLFWILGDAGPLAGGGPSGRPGFRSAETVSRSAAASCRSRFYAIQGRFGATWVRGGVDDHPGRSPE